MNREGLSLLSPHLRIYSVGDAYRRTKLPREEVIERAVKLKVGIIVPDENRMHRRHILLNDVEIQKISCFQPRKASSRAVGK